LAEYLKFILPYLPPESHSPNSRAHFRVKGEASRSVRDDIRVLIREAGWGGERWPAANCWVVFHLPTKHRRDPDNLTARMVPVWNALVREGLLVDDNIDVIGWPVYSHVYGKPAQTVVALERVEQKLTHTARLTR